MQRLTLSRTSIFWALLCLLWVGCAGACSAVVDVRATVKVAVNETLTAFSTLVPPPSLIWAWTCGDSGCPVDETVAHSGKRSLQLTNGAIASAQAALQPITLNQTEPRTLHFSGWSKAQNVTGDPDIHYSLYLDIYDTNDNWLYQKVLQFNTGTHDWQFQEGHVIPNAPIGKIHFHCLLRQTHNGTAWFDDLSVREAVTPSVELLNNAGFEENMSGAADD
jgi:hypothetical protein